MRSFRIIFLFAVAFSIHTMGNSQAYYEKAIGVKYIPTNGFGVTGKYFLNNSSAIEAILGFRDESFGETDYYWYNFQALYELHIPMKFVTDGLQVYFGGGAYVGFYSCDPDISGGYCNSAIAGLSAIVGLDYKFAKAPINLSADWNPSFALTTDDGSLVRDRFDSEVFGLSVRYTFGK